MAAKEATKVTAVVVRGSYWKLDDEGHRTEIKPGLGKDSEVQVTESQLRAFSGVLVAAKDAPAEIAKAADEGLTPVTTAEDATSPPADTPSNRARR